MDDSTEDEPAEPIARKRRRLSGSARRRIVFTTIFVIVAGWGVRHWWHRHLASQLVEAVKANDFSTASRLLNAGVDANAMAPDENSWPEWKLITARALHEELPPDKSEPVLLWLLDSHSASGGRTVVPPQNVSLLDALVAHGANTAARNWAGNTPLTLAARNGEEDSCLALVQAGADVRARDTREESALMEAAAFCSLKTVRLIVEHGASVNTVDVDGNSPLMWAMDAARLPNIKYLLAHGAIPDQKNFKGISPDSRVEDSSDIELKSLFKAAESMK